MRIGQEKSPQTPTRRIGLSKNKGVCDQKAMMMMRVMRGFQDRGTKTSLMMDQIVVAVLTTRQLVTSLQTHAVGQDKEIKVRLLEFITLM